MEYTIKLFKEPGEECSWQGYRPIEVNHSKSKRIIVRLPPRLAGQVNYVFLEIPLGNPKHCAAFAHRLTEKSNVIGPPFENGDRAYVVATAEMIDRFKCVIEPPF